MFFKDYLINVNNGNTFKKIINHFDIGYYQKVEITLKEYLNIINNIKNVNDIIKNDEDDNILIKYNGLNSNNVVDDKFYNNFCIDDAIKYIDLKNNKMKNMIKFKYIIEKHYNNYKKIIYEFYSYNNYFFKDSKIKDNL